MVDAFLHPSEAGLLAIVGGYGLLLPNSLLTTPLGPGKLVVRLAPGAAGTVVRQQTQTSASGMPSRHEPYWGAFNSRSWGGSQMRLPGWAAWPQHRAVGAKPLKLLPAKRMFFGK